MYFLDFIDNGPRNLNQIVTILFFRPRGGYLGFQNGRHFQPILAYISTSEQPRELKMVPNPMFMMLRIIVKVLRKLLVVVILEAILNFKMAAIFYLFWAIISTSELPRELKMVDDVKDYNKST